MSKSFSGFASALTLATLLATHDAQAQAPSDGSIELPQIVVEGQVDRAGSLTVPSVEQQRRMLNQTAGAVSFVDTNTPELKSRYTFNLRDLLEDTPGVFVQNRYGQELRVSVRGSGIARGYHTRGIDILQDGIPTNLADGSGDFYEIDPLAARSVEVYKGGNGLLYGSGTLGGAINVTTPTAYTATAPNSLRIDGGSFGTIRGNAQFSRVLGDFDVLGNLTVTHSDGFRQHSRSQYEQFNANAGYRISPNAETRFYFGTYIIDQQLPGALSLSDALHHPKVAAASALQGNQARDVWAERIANKTTIQFDVGQLDIGTWVTHKRLFHPIFQVIDQDGWTYGILPRYSATLSVGGMRDDIVVGSRLMGGNTTALQFVNVAGSRGAQTLNARQDAANYEGFVENRLFFLPTVALMTGVKVLRDERDYIDEGGLAADRTYKSYHRSYDGLNPKLGLIWQPTKDIQAFVDITRAQDVPDFTDLTQTQANGATGFVPLQAQRAYTTEIGTRGNWGRFGWDVTAYHSVVHGELLQFSTNFDVPASTFNAGTTIHQGIEFGGKVDLARNLSGPGSDDAITLAQVWTYNDFRFSNDRQYGRNRIAGIPQHVLRTTLSYHRADGLFVAPALDWVPQGAFADYANTLRAPGYALIGLQAGLDLRPGVTLSVDLRNLADKHYASDISTIANARAPGASTQIFYPGDGRSVFAGLHTTF